MIPIVVSKSSSAHSTVSANLPVSIIRRVVRFSGVDVFFAYGLRFVKVWIVGDDLDCGVASVGEFVEIDKENEVTKFLRAK